MDRTQRALANPQLGIVHKNRTMSYKGENGWVVFEQDESNPRAEMCMFKSPDFFKALDELFNTEKERVLYE